MTALPASTDFTGAAITKGQFKTAVTDLRAFLASLIGADGTIAMALATIQAPFGGGVVAKSGAYTVVAGDRGKVISCTGTWSLSLTAAATLGAGFVVSVVNDGTGVITIDPNASETIDGAATLALGAGLSAIIVCTGTAWLVAAKETTAYVEPTLATGSTVYAQELAEVTQAITNGAYQTALASRASDGAIARWAAITGNLMAIRVDHAGSLTVSVDIDRDDLDTCYARLLVNGTQQVQWTVATSFETKTQNVTVSKGDIVAIQARKDTNDTDIRVKNFKLLVAALP